MKRIIILLFCLIVAMGSIGCIKPKAPKFQQIQSIDLIHLSKDSISVLITGEFENPNRLGTTITKLEYEIFLDGKLCGRGQREQVQEIPSKSNFILNIPITITANDWDVWKNALLKMDTVDVRIPAQVSVKLWFFKHTFSVQSKTKYALYKEFEKWAKQELKKFSPKIENIHLSKAGLGKQSFSSTVVLENPYPFEIQVDSLLCNVSVNGNEVGAIENKETIHLLAGQMNRNDYQFDITTESAVRTVLTGILQRGYTYEVKGSAVVKIADFRSEVPIQLKGDVLQDGFKGLIGK